MKGGNGKVAYIDTEGTFRPDRIVPIAEGFGMDPGAVLDNIIYARAYTYEHQYNLLLGLAAKMSEEPFRILIVDSVIALFRVDFIKRRTCRPPGLNVEVDRILEIACIITDGNLTKSVEGPDLVVHQTKDCLDKMGDWFQTHHGASGLTQKVLLSTISEKQAEQEVTLGLTEKVLLSTISEKQAEQEVIEFVKKHVGSENPLLAGNSVYVDFLFLKKYMPDLAALFPHVLVDVSSVKALCFRWFPKEKRRAPAKKKNHRAMDDIRESIKELKYYKETIFKVNRARR